MSGAIGTGRDMPEALKQALARTAGTPDFQSLEALMEENSDQVFALFGKIIGASEA
jgi:hypothetical protein